MDFGITGLFKTSCVSKRSDTAVFQVLCVTNTFPSTGQRLFTKISVDILSGISRKKKEMNRDIGCTLRNISRMDIV